MSFFDQLNNCIELKQTPKRIVCLVPSITELLAYFKLDNEVVGITKFCFEPKHWHKNKARVGGTKTINIEAIKQLKPDLIIANKEENDKIQIEQLQNNYNVFVSNIFTLKDALNMISILGSICQKQIEATHLNKKINAAFLQFKAKELPILKAAYFIWDKPPMVAANNTFINNLLKYAGFANVFNDLERYPSIDENQLKAANPDVLLLSSEPFPFKEAHIEKYQNILPNAKILLVDGTMFSWYGNRLVNAPAYYLSLRNLI